MSLDDRLRRGLHAGLSEGADGSDVVALAEAKARGRTRARHQRRARAATSVVVVLLLMISVGAVLRSARNGDPELRTAATDPDAATPVRRALFDPMPRVDLFDAGVLGEPGFYTRTIAAGGDGNLWLITDSLAPNPENTPKRTAAVVRVALDGTVTPFPIFIDAKPTALFDLIKGPDGNPWFAASTSDGTTTGTAWAIGTVSADGAVHIFAAGLEGVRPVRLSAGRDGALWFYERYDDPAHVQKPRTGRGRMTSDGTVTHVAISERSYVNELLYLPEPAENVDVDDRSWPFDPTILEQRPMLIAALPPTNGTTWQLRAVGAADAGWEKPFVRRIAADGTFTDFHFDEYDALGQSQGYGPLGNEGFAVAPDGALWLALDLRLADPGAGAIVGRLTPDGAFSEMTLTRGVSSIAIDVNGNVWFTTRPPRDERGPLQGYIGRIVVAPRPADGGAPVPTIPSDDNGCVPGAVHGTVPDPWARSLAVLGGPVCATTKR
jgi:hypothetical protein